MTTLGVFALPFDDPAGFTAPPAFGPFRVLHQIGSGVLGPVFRTFDPRRDKLVAVKAFRLDVVPEVSGRLADELSRLASTPVDHPAVVATIDAGLEGTTAYLAMEYVAAETLDVSLRRLAPCSVEVAVPVLRQVAEGIEAAWAEGLGHGSLHPRDIFVPSTVGESAESTEGVRVAGFGVTAALEKLNITVPLRRPYAAPERGHGGPWDIRADVYSLGVIAHELLIGERPVGSLEEYADGSQPDMDPDVRRALAGALAVDATYRFQTPTAFVDALGMGGVPRVFGREATPKSQATPAPEPAHVFWTRESEAELTAEANTEPEAEQEAQAEPAPDLVVAEASVERPLMWPPPVAEAAEVRDTWRVTPEPKEARPRFPGSVLLVIGLVVGAGFGFWLRGPSPDAPVAPVDPNPTPIAVTTVPEEETLATEVAVKPTATPAPPPTATPAASAQPLAVSEPSANRGRLLVRSVPSGATPVRAAAPATPGATTGTLDVSSTPRRATVSIDGRVVGTAPLRVLELSPGPHTVRVELAGHKVVTTTVVIRAGQPTPLRVTLEIQ